MKKNIFLIAFYFISVHYICGQEKMDISILIDTQEYILKEDGALTQQLLCNIADDAFPILVSKELFYHLIRHIHSNKNARFYLAKPGESVRAFPTPSEQESASDFEKMLKLLEERFVIKDVYNFYLLLPRNLFRELEVSLFLPESHISDLEKKYGLKFQHFKTIDLKKEFSEGFKEWKNFNLSYDMAKDVLPNIFISKDSTSVHWYIHILGHGQWARGRNISEQSTFGMNVIKASQVLHFFKKNINVECMFLASCFLKANTPSLFAYHNEGIVVPEEYPFDIIFESVGDTVTTGVSAGGLSSFMKTCPSALKSLFKALHKTKDYFSAFASANFIDYTEMAANVLHVLPKNSDLLLPLTPPNKSVLVISHVIGKTRKKPLVVPSETTMILLHPAEINFPLVFKFISRYAPARISSMHIGSAFHKFKEIILDVHHHSANEQFDFLYSLFAPLYSLSSTKKFFIQKVLLQKVCYTLRYMQNSQYAAIPINALDNIVIIAQPKDTKEIEVDNNEIKIYFSCQHNGESYYIYGRYEYLPKFINWKEEINLKALLETTYNKQQLIFNRISEHEYKQATF